MRQAVRERLRRTCRADRLWLSICTTGTFVVLVEEVLRRGHL